MTNKVIVGIDISKHTLDCCFIYNSAIEQIKISNDKSGIKEFNKWLCKKKKFCYQNAVFCMEHTGIYTKPILLFLKEKQTTIWLENAVHIKKSMGFLVRGKNDKVDAERIAHFAEKNIENIKEWKPKSNELETIKALLTLRDNLVIQIKQIDCYINEYAQFGDKQISKLLQQNTKQTRTALKKEIKNIETRIEEIISNDQQLNTLYDVITSIPGIGKITAWFLIVETNEFKLFTSPRSLACHCGVAPFENSSGLFKGKSRVSHLANKRLKTALHMASLTAVKIDSELKMYYERKVAEGKSKMSVLNAVRNKLVHRVFSCQKNNKKYIKKVA